MYLTTDSDIVETYLKDHLHQFFFFEKNPYKCGHSSDGSKGFFIKGGIYDAIMTLRTSVLFLTSSSSFGFMIRLISYEGRSCRLPLYRG